MKKNYKQLSRFGLLAFAILISFLPILNPLQIFSSLQNYSFDTFQRILPREVYPEDPVVIIDIDDRSLADIGQWPWSRNQLAKLTNQAYAAAALGVSSIERHITLDRAMYGSDQAASLSPPGLKKIVPEIRKIEKALGDGIKRVIEDEVPIAKKLRQHLK